jgi:hypothetical protein
MSLLFRVAIETDNSGIKLLPDSPTRSGFSLSYDDLIHCKQCVMQAQTTGKDIYVHGHFYVNT